MRNNGDGTTPCIVVEDGRPYGGATGTPLSLITKGKNALFFYRDY